MRILFLTSSMSSGGAERVASTISNAWALRGDHVILMPTFSGGGECFYQLSPSVRLVYLADLVSSQSRTVFNMINRLLTLRRFIRDENPDVIISFLPNVNVAAIVASLGLRIPVVISERNDRFANPLTFFWKVLCRVTYPLANALVLQTQALAHKYRSSGKNLRLIHVIPNPISKRMLEVQRSRVHEKKNGCWAWGGWFIRNNFIYSSKFSQM